MTSPQIKILISTAAVSIVYAFVCSIGCPEKPVSVHPQMVNLPDFRVERLGLNPQNSALFLRFKPRVRLELEQICLIRGRTPVSSQTGSGKNGPASGRN